MREQLDNFRRDGIFRLDNVFTFAELQAVQRAFEHAIADPPEGMGIIYEDHDPTVVRSIMGWQRSEGILSCFARDERIMTWVRAILGDQVVFHQTKCNPKAPSGKGEPWDPHRGDTFWCFRDGVPRSSGLLSVFIALTDQTEENGAVYAWPGSHAITLDQIKPHMLGLDESHGTERDTAATLSLQVSSEKLAEIERDCERMLLTGPAGTVWVLDAGTLHASQENGSDATRTLVANVFRRVDNPPAHPRSPRYLCETSPVPLLASPAGDLVRHMA